MPTQTSEIEDSNLNYVDIVYVERHRVPLETLSFYKGDDKKVVCDNAEDVFEKVLGKFDNMKEFLWAMELVGDPDTWEVTIEDVK